jgi:hypothetical protein
MKTDGIASVRQYAAPSVLGMISEKYRIASVSRTAISTSHLTPKICTAWEPTPAAPMVWAKVFSIRMLEIDSSRRPLTRLSTAPARGFSARSVST